MTWNASHGYFCWHELLSKDPAGAKAFYPAFSGGEQSMVWERRGAAGVEPLVRLEPAARAGQSAKAVHVTAVLDRPDGSRWFVGAELCYLPGQPYCGWIYRLPALLACPAGSAVPP